MAYDEGLADLLREDLEEVPGIREKRMFGGLCFLRDGHMVSGIYQGEAMYRVGKANTFAALAHEGVSLMTMKDKPMAGFVTLSEEMLGEDAVRADLLRLALSFVATLEPK